MSTEFDRLLARAGASDQDKEVWLQERRLGLTATQAKELYMGADMEAMAMQKVISNGAIDDNKYMAWGRYREPIVADVVSARYPGYMLEHRVFKAETDPRLLASPDMVCDDDGVIRLCEIKTSGWNLDPMEDHFDVTGYLYQMQWQMLVCGAESCLFAWEQHNGDWVDSGREFPEPSGVLPVQIVDFERDERIIQEMKDMSVEFFRVFDETLEDFGGELW